MIRYNQVKGIKKSGSTDQSNHRFPTLTTAYSHCIFYYTYLSRLCQVVKIPKLKVLPIHKIGLQNPNSQHAFLWVYLWTFLKDVVTDRVYLQNVLSSGVLTG